jgi:hypothetical protein
MHLGGLIFRDCRRGRSAHRERMLRRPGPASRQGEVRRMAAWATHVAALGGRWSPGRSPIN